MSSRPSRGAARLAAILDALPDGLVLVNCNGTVVNANTIALGMFETPGTALVGRGLLDLLPGFDSRLIPGSMRRPEGTDARGRTKPTRMIARRTDGSEFAVEVTSASLEDGREAYDSYSAYTGDELLMLVVRDLTGTLDTEAELARSQRQTEMILRAAAEGVVGTDTDGRVVLVNPAAAQILGYRASDLGGKELHPLILHSRADGEPFPYEGSPLADTLKSGRKHRVRNQVLWSKNGAQVPVDLTTAPVRDGDQLVGAVMTFTDRRPYEQLAEKHAAELADAAERHAVELERQAEVLEREKERYEALTARHEQLTAVLGESLRGPLEELRTELATLAADDAGQLWPEANQLLHHLAAGYARMTTLVDNVLGYQRLDAGAEALDKSVVLLDRVVGAGVDGAVELIGPGRAQFAVHAPPIEAEVDAGRLATALAHLVADVAGVDSTGKARVVPGAGYADSTIVVAAAQRGDVVRIEVRGPYAGGDAVHQPIVRGIVAAHGGVVQTHEVPGMSGSAYVLEFPLGAGKGTVAAPAAAPAGVRPELGPVRDAAADASEASDPAAQGQGARLALPAQASETQGGGRRRARRASTDAFLESPVAAEGGTGAGTGAGPGGGAVEPTGRRRGRTEDGPAAPAELIPAQNAGTGSTSGTEPTGRRRGRPAEGAVVTAAEGAQGRAARGDAVPPQGVPVPAQGTPVEASSRARALPAVASGEADAASAQPTGRRARRALAAQERTAAADAGPRTPFALPPADADRPAEQAAQTGPAAPFTAPQQAPQPAPRPSVLPVSDEGRHDAVRSVPDAGPTPPQAHPEPTGRRRGPGSGIPQETRSVTGTGSVPLPPEAPAAAQPAQPVPVQKDRGQGGRAFSVRTLGQGVPFAQQIAAQQTGAQPGPPAAAQTGGQNASNGSGRRRKLATPPEGDRPAPAPTESAAKPHPHTNPQPSEAPSQPLPQPKLGPPAPEGRAYAIGAPAEGSAEGPEPLDGPGGAVEVANKPLPQPVDDELPPEPLDNPRRLLVWPAPDVSTQQALSDRGYRPVIVHSREEVDAQIAAFPAALFVDPLTGPITRTALQSLRQAAVAAEVPVLLAAGLGQATREAAYGADPAVLLKALAPRDSEQHPSRVLLIEENEEIAQALAATLERRGMQVARAEADAEAVTLAAQMRPNLVVMDLMQVRRRRAGIIDWLRANGQLNRTPLVVYTSAGIDEAELPKLSSGETVLFLAERSTSNEVQARIVDLLAKIGTN
ncbi:PAS domain-containing protein [Streptomyces sp. QHH-9511]|uniref:hybrid sensor histidine kinase/response regulator n=1 Tax=Streptomyces sp. QHH-9511 TaxID=2684468 RepID=UPI001316571C|nr:PAS domain-containing protein [Streptomyces sp. QHH-9511]QGZ49998.1 PAS domain-containing protein [Streptomyces sp. QHH-9511]